MIRTLLHKTFGLRDGEIFISFLMQLYIFLIITVLLMVKPTVNALFLSKLGADQLPYAYLLVALTAVLASYIYNRIVKKISLLKVTTTSLVIFSLGFISLSLILHNGFLSNWVLYAYYLGVALFAVLATSQFWILANLVFNPREGKRLFGFIGAGAIAGGIFGGYLTSILASAHSNKVVILVAGILILCCIPIIRKVWSLRIYKMNTYIRHQIKELSSNTEESSSLKIVLNSKHLTHLALITGIGVFVAKLVDFQFSDFANKAISDPDELTSFFGFWFSSFNVIALCIQLLLTNRILSKIGVTTTLLILPLAIALGALLFLTFPELWVLVIIKGIDASFKQSLNKAAFELSIMPIPLRIKNQAKSFIDVAVDSVATGISGITLILLVRRLNLSTWYVTVIIILLVFIWIILIYRLRETYYNSFRENIQRTLSENIALNENAKKETTLTTARRILNEGSETEILTLLDRLRPYKIKILKYHMIELLDHPSNKIKAEVIRQFNKYDAKISLEKVEALVHEKDDVLVYMALSYILDHSVTDENSFFNSYLDHEDPYISNAALLCLAEEASNNQKLSIKFALSKRLDNRIFNLSNAQKAPKKEDVAALLNIIAYSNRLKYYSFIKLNLEHEHPFIVKQAIRAAGITANKEFLEPLLEFLPHKKFRKNAIKALNRYGPEMINTIVRMDKNQDLKDNIKQYLPRVIQKFNTPRSLRVLMGLLSSKDVVIRLEASTSLSKLKRKHTKLKLNPKIIRHRILLESRYYRRTLSAIATLTPLVGLEQDIQQNDRLTDISVARQRIIDLLEEQLGYSLRCIFNLLGIIYNKADIEMTYSGLLSEVKEARLNALEFLDNMVQSQLKTSILPLIEYSFVEKNESIVHLKVTNEISCIKRLVKNRGKRTKVEALNLIKVLNNKSYLSIASALRKHKNKDVQYLARETYAFLKGNVK